MDRLTVGVLAHPGCFASEVFGVPDLLTIAGHVAPTGPRYETVVLSSRRRVVAAGGVDLAVRPVRPVDLLVVPGFECPPGTEPESIAAAAGPELGAIRAQVASGGAVVSICVGAFLLAEAGVLDGRGATTSWLYADRLALRYPAVAVDQREMVVADGPVTTTAAFSAMYDFALSLIREHDGAAVARRTARVALVDDARSTQSPYVDPDMVRPLGRSFSDDVKRRLDRDLAAPYRLAGLADALHVSTRTLLRRFRDETGRTPLAYLQSARVHRARHLLERTDRTVASIAGEVGYTDHGAFTAVFAKHAGCRPRDYRAAFRRTGPGRLPAEADTRVADDRERCAGT